LIWRAVTAPVHRRDAYLSNRGDATLDAIAHLSPIVWPFVILPTMADIVRAIFEWGFLGPQTWLLWQGEYSRRSCIFR
jgi:hypothetical protein